MIKTITFLFLTQLFTARLEDLRPLENIFSSAVAPEMYITDRIDLTAEAVAKVFKPLHYAALLEK